MSGRKLENDFEMVTISGLTLQNIPESSNPRASLGITDPEDEFWRALAIRNTVREPEIARVREEAYYGLLSISHELRSLMNSVTATAANLLRGDIEWDFTTTRELLGILVDETDRLSNEVSGLLALERASAEEAGPNREEYNEESRWGAFSIREDEGPEVITVGDIDIDLRSHRVTVAGDEVKLTPTEFRLLCYLASHTGKVISHGELLHHLWGPEYRNRRGYLRVFVAQLRRKMEPNPRQPKYIVTVSHWGYCLQDQNAVLVA